MTTFPGAPAGFVRRDGAGAALYADPADLDALVRAGLDRPAAWPRSGGMAPESGRGPVAVVETGAGKLFLKMLRRGGALARLRDERFRGHRRLLDNLTLPAAARRLGVPTPRVVALRLEPAGGAYWRGYLASEHLDGARSLVEVLREGPPGEGVLAAAMGAVRVSHDLGLAHADLNLGNVLVRRRPGGLEGCVVDLDRARLVAGPLPFGRRLRELRRLERSYAKALSGAAPLGADGFAAGFLAYAGADDSLARRLEAGRKRWVWTLRWRSLRWRMAGR